jgi:hypothetical protein
MAASKTHTYQYLGGSFILQLDMRNVTHYTPP